MSISTAKTTSSNRCISIDLLSTTGFGVRLGTAGIRLGTGAIGRVGGLLTLA